MQQPKYKVGDKVRYDDGLFSGIAVIDHVLLTFGSYKYGIAINGCGWLLAEVDIKELINAAA